MINEILFMEIRILRMFLEKHPMDAAQANRLFDDYGIWAFLETCYDALHVSGDESVLNDIEEMLIAKGGLS